LSARQRGYFDAIGVLICEVALLAILLRAGSALGTVDLSHLATWLRATSPQRVLTAWLRLLGTAVSGWLLLTTVFYGVAALSGKRGFVRQARPLTLPVLRRALDAMAAASVAASSIGSTAALAGAAVPVHQVAVVQPLRPPRPVVLAAARASRDYGGAPSVANTAIGRHFPHPGQLDHEPPGTAPPAARPKAVPSQANGFAGLARGTKVVVVEPGDCLSVLAERHLGDWRLDSEIEALNFGRLQPDGRALVNDHWIYPGWVLIMPPGSVGAEVVGGANTERPPAGHEATPLAVPVATSPLSHHPVQPRGAVPLDGARSPERVATKRPATKGPATKRPATEQAARKRLAPDAPLREAEPPSVSKAHPERDGSAARHGHHELLAAAGVAAIAAAGIIWRLDRSRREQLHTRLRGRLIAPNRPAVQAVERRARAIASEEAMSWVDLGVRYLSGLVEQQSLSKVERVPSVVLVHAGRRGLEVRVSPSVKGPLGWFEASDDGTRLLLDAEITLEELRALAAERWPAWPALVSLGNDADGALLLNLEHAGSLSVEGPEERVQGTLARIALELSTQPWSDEMLSGLYLIGECSLDERLRGAHRVAGDEAMDLAEVLDRVSAARQELAAGLSLSVLRAVACEAPPNVAVAFAGAPPEALRCLAEAAVPERSGIAVAGAGPFTGARWSLVIRANGDALLSGPIDERPVSFDLKLACDPEEVGLLSEALGATVERGGRPAEECAGSAPLGESVIDIRSTLAPPERGEVEVCLLGPVEVAGGDMSALEPSRRMAALAVLAYMAAHDRPVNADELGGALWPLDATKDNLGGPQRKTVMNVISRARLVLGYGARGQERLAYSAQGYRLVPEVTSDWARFETLVARARLASPADAIGALRIALELVRGEPFGGALSSQFFEWVASEHLDLMLTARVADTAEDLGELALEAGDFETVLWAVGKGLQLDPTREELFRLWMHALGRSDRPAKVDDVYRRLMLVLRQRIHPLQEPQEASREVWRSYTAAEAGSRPT
jgi:DNA-binding SARP family transcriptional activator